METCARNGCEQQYTKKTHNQKYCSDECCRIATNAKIMERYYENKRLRSGAVRLCKTCNSKLSRYNMLSQCSICEAKKITDQNILVLQQTSTIIWD